MLPVYVIRYDSMPQWGYPQPEETRVVFVGQRTVFDLSFDGVLPMRRPGARGGKRPMRGCARGSAGCWLNSARARNSGSEFIRDKSAKANRE